MNSYSLYQLKCPACSLEYTHMITENEEHLLIPCPSCDTALKKVKKLTGAELLSCVYSYGGG